VFQTDLAGRGERAAGLAGLLVEEAAAPGGVEEAGFDLVLVEGAGGDEVVQVAARLPELVVAPTLGCGGEAAELAGERAAGPRVPLPVHRRQRRGRERVGGLGAFGQPLQRAGQCRERVVEVTRPGVAVS
jgi:hypothetical protein